MAETQDKPPQPASQPPQPQKPVFPANTTTREGHQPLRPAFPGNGATKDMTEIIRNPNWRPRR